MKHPSHTSWPHSGVAHAATRTYRPSIATSRFTTDALGLVNRIEAALDAARSGRHTLFAITLSPGFEVRGEDGEARLWATVREWSATVDGGPLGFNRTHLYRATCHRPAYGLVFQHGHTAWHYHGVVSVLNKHVPAYLREAPRLWRVHSHGGSMDVKLLRDVGWHEYSLRKIERGDETEPTPKLLLRTLPEHCFFEHFPEPVRSTEVHH